MPDRVARLLCVLLLAVLAGAPAVRTLCAWDCGRPMTTAAASPGAEHGGHCAPPADAATSGAALLALGGCESCDPAGDAVRATMRAASAGPAPALRAPAWSAARVDPTSSGPAVAPTRAASPPLRAPYPLRI